MTTKKYYLNTFGCQMNKSDSERIEAKLKDLGYRPASQIEKADLIVINMCSVRQSAVDRVYGRFRQFKKLKKNKSKLKILLTGCVLRTDFNKLKQGFDYILSIKTLPFWQEILKKDNFYYSSNSRDSLSRKRCRDSYLNIAPAYCNNFSAYLPITVGCDNFCSYCVVPYTRGPMVSRPSKKIITEIKNLVKKGFKEIWLIGENVNSWEEKGKNLKVDSRKKAEKLGFSDLLKMINKIPGNFWVSFTSSHPKDFSDELIKTMVKCEKVTHYISLPLQAGDNEVLKKMNRPYTINDYKKIVKKIRKAIPDVYLSTDIIVGFPGETKKRFENTIKLFKELQFDMAYIAEYSPRPGTRTFKIKDGVPLKEKQRRREVLTKVLEEIATKKNKKYLGKEVEVLVSEMLKGKFLVGKTKNYCTVKIVDLPEKTETTKMIGKLVKAKVIGVIPWGLKAHLAP